MILGSIADGTILDACANRAYTGLLMSVAVRQPVAAEYSFIGRPHVERIDEQFQGCVNDSSSMKRMHSKLRAMPSHSASQIAKCKWREDVQTEGDPHSPATPPFENGAICPGSYHCQKTTPCIAYIALATRNKSHGCFAGMTGKWLEVWNYPPDLLVARK